VKAEEFGHYKQEGEQINGKQREADEGRSEESEAAGSD
jgi:hypothetical protein